jgi:hypothetical protein
MISKIIKSIIVLSLLYTQALAINSSIQGFVLNAQMQPIINASVFLLDSSSNLLIKTTSDTNGYYGFDISIKGNYQIVAMTADSSYQGITDIELYAEAETKDFGFVFTAYGTNKKVINQSIAAKDLEKQASTDINKQIATKNTRVMQNGRGNLLSTSNNQPVKYIVDGQILGVENVQMVPGTVQQVDVISR